MPLISLNQPGGPLRLNGPAQQDDEFGVRHRRPPCGTWGQSAPFVTRLKGQPALSHVLRNDLPHIPFMPMPVIDSAERHGLRLRDVVGAPDAQGEQFGVRHGPPISRVVPDTAHDASRLENQVAAWRVLNVIDEFKHDPLPSVDYQVTDGSKDTGQTPGFHSRPGPSWPKGVGHAQKIANTWRDAPRGEPAPRGKHRKANSAALGPVKP